MLELLTHSAQETRAFGEKLAQRLRGGDVLLLEGELGAGKSELTRGIARGLGVTGPVTSPSFTILQVYGDGRLPLYHFDWYRLSAAEELYELSMDEYLYDDGVAVVEWPDRAAEAIPKMRLRVILRACGENERAIRLQPEGGFRALEGLGQEVAL